MITNIDPLIIYAYPEGLTRFASELYEKPSEQNYGNMYMHLTNTNININETQ